MSNTVGTVRSVKMAKAPVVKLNNGETSPIFGLGTWRVSFQYVLIYFLRQVGDLLTKRASEVCQRKYVYWVPAHRVQQALRKMLILKNR